MNNKNDPRLTFKQFTLMTTRRTFLAQAGVLGAGLVLAPGLLSAKGKAVAGLQLYSLREQLPKDVKGVIAKVAAAGYREVETFGYSKAGGFWGLSAAEFKTLLKQHGLSSPSGHYGMNEFLHSGELKEVEEAIEAAKIVGQQYVTFPYVMPGDRKTAADLQNIVAKVNLAAEKISAAGLKMAYHNHDFEFENVEGVRLYDLLLNGTRPSQVHFEMDLYWVVRAGQNPVEWFTKYPGRFPMVHVKDMNKQKPELNTEVGTGSVDFKSIFAKAKLGGIKHYIVEQENFVIDPYKSIAESSTYLRTVLLK